MIGRDFEVASDSTSDFCENGGGNGASVVIRFGGFEGNKDTDTRVMCREIAHKRACIIGGGIATWDGDLGGTSFPRNLVAWEACAPPRTPFLRDCAEHKREVRSSFFRDGTSDGGRFIMEDELAL